MISWVVSDRSQEAADTIIRDLNSRITWPDSTLLRWSVALPGSGHEGARPGKIDHAEVIKTFASSSKPDGVSPNGAASRYSPGRMLSVEERTAFGEPDEKHASTSFMERWNLTFRMQNRRFTRLTNAFSKELENHDYMLAISMVHYNFCRKRKTLKGNTPAMAPGLTSYRWTASDMLSLGHVVREGGGKLRVALCRLRHPGRTAATLPQLDDVMIAEEVIFEVRDVNSDLINLPGQRGKAGCSCHLAA